MDEQTTCEQLRETWPTVRYAHLNWVGNITSGASDPSYSFQHSVASHGPLPLPGSPANNAHINVEGAWGITSGQSTPPIKVGVFDSGIRRSHVDFSLGGTSNVVAIDGFNVNNGATGGVSTGTSSPIFNDMIGHGTKVAGLIGAVRNNTEGIAGIAGGDGASNPGVRLYSMKITNGSSVSTLDRISSAILYGADPTNGFGQQIMNHSWDSSPPQPFNRRYQDYGVLMDAIRQAYNNGVVSVAGAGNGPQVANALVYPANAKDNWVIAVGGTGVNASGDANIWNEAAAANDPEYQTTPSPAVDVAAPATDLLVETLSAFIPGTLTPDDYAVDSFNGTSAATPHVSGTVALMLSAYKQDNPNDALRPDDVEHILETTARDVSPSGRDDYTGAGLINATAAVAGVKSRNYGYIIRHVSLNADPTDVTVTPEGPRQLYYIEGGKQFGINTPNPGPAPAGNTSVREGVYYAQAYKVTRTGPSYGSLPSREPVIGIWGLNGSINAANSVPFTLYGPPVSGFNDFPGSGTTKLVTAEPGVEMEPGSFRKTKVTLVGYAYELIDFYPLNARPTGSPAGTPYTVSTVRQAPAHPWIPFNPQSNLSGAVRKMSYTVWSVNLLMPPAFRSSGLGSSAFDEAPATGVGAYPNPARTQITLLFPAETDEEVTTELLTTDGKVVRTVQQTSKPFGALHAVEVSLAGLPTGLYFYRIVTQKAVRQGRFIKAD